MKLLLDSQAFVYIELYPERLSEIARAAIEDVSNAVYLSIVTPIELQIKINQKKIEFRKTISSIVNEELSDGTFELLPINLKHIDALSRLPLHHRDPFDRLLIAQAISDDLTIVTGDEKIRQYPVQTLWR